MELSYDPRYGVAYIRLQHRTPDAPVETVQLADDVNIDLAPDGTLFGIELLNANEQLRGADGCTIVVTNSETGDRRELPLHLGS